MATTQINSTRMELSKSKKKHSTATKGHNLLKDKRDELMRRFLEMAKTNRELRIAVESEINKAIKNFNLANAMMSSEVLSASILVQKQKLFIDVFEKNVMGVSIPLYTINNENYDSNKALCYGYAFTSSELDDAVASLSSVVPLMLKLAEVEKSCQLMSAEIEKTRRRVNALEHIVIPDTAYKIKYITMKLDENERSNQTRLMKVKDMTLKKAHKFN